MADKIILLKAKCNRCADCRRLTGCDSKMVQECTLEKVEKQQLVRCLAKNLRSLRTSLGWSQEKLAELIGVTRQTVLAVENGKRDMTWTMFLAFSFLFLGNEKTHQEFLDSGAYTDKLAAYLFASERRK